MVSLGKYIKTFIAVMPKRGKIIRSLGSRKKEIDARLLNTNALDENDIQELCLIIGQDKKLYFFRDKKWKPTLRHTLGKCIRSVDFFIRTNNQFSDFLRQNEEEFLRKYGDKKAVYRRMKVYTPKIMQFLDGFYGDAKRLLDILEKLSMNYERQYTYLKNGYINGYKELLDAEQEQILSLTEILKIISSRQKSLLNFVRLFIDEFKKPSEDELFVKEAGSWMLAGTVTLILVFLLVFISEFTGQGFIKNPEQWIGVSIMAFAGSTLVGIVDGLVSSLRINPVKNLILAVEKFASKSI